METPYSRTIVGRLPWYSALIVMGILLAVRLAGREERRLGLPEDTSVDAALVAVPCGIVGARLYYVLMRWEVFAPHPLSALYIWQGGLAIYGGVLGGMLGLWVYARRKKLSWARVMDMLVPGVLLAQALGRWGNYFNQEAYGPLLTDPRLQRFPLAVLVDGEWHAATFFYESMWNLCGFALLWSLRREQKRPGNGLAWYLLIYGSGRFIIEQLRQDSLYLAGMRISQLVSLAACAGAAAVLLTQRRRRRGLALLGAALWLLRWAFVGQPAFYAPVSLAAMGLALLCGSRRAVLWTAVDLAGLFLAALGWPVSAQVALAVHAALCSATLPLQVLALTRSDAKENALCPSEP